MPYDESPELDTQLNTFEEEEQADDAELKKRFEHVSHINLQDIDAVFSAIKEMAKEKGISQYLLELLQSLIAIKVENETGYIFIFKKCKKKSFYFNTHLFVHLAFVSGYLRQKSCVKFRSKKQRLVMAISK